VVDGGDEARHAEAPLAPGDRLRAHVEAARVIAGPGLPQEVSEVAARVEETCARRHPALHPLELQAAVPRVRLVEVVVLVAVGEEDAVVRLVDGDAVGGGGEALADAGQAAGG